WVHLGAADQAPGALRLRRIRLQLPSPTRDGDDTIVDACDWQVFQCADAAVMAPWLRNQAARLTLARYRKSVRSTRNVPVKLGCAGLTGWVVQQSRPATATAPPPGRPSHQAPWP
ncbi:MAG: hypothetical protein RLZZ584_371, partial [Pseudomonadota bacterium]